MFICTYVYMYICIYADVNLCTYVYVCMYIYIFICIYVCIYAHKCAYMYILCIYMDKYIYIYKYIYIFNIYGTISMYTYKYIYIDLFIHTYTNIYAYSFLLFYPRFKSTTPPPKGIKRLEGCEKGDEERKNTRNTKLPFSGLHPTNIQVG